MKLRFYARGDLLVRDPLFRPTFTGGQVPQYVGRQPVRPNDGSAAMTFPATREAHVIDAAIEPKAARRLETMCRRDSALWAADEETAGHCGVPFVEVKFSEGEWVEKQPKRSAKPALAKTDKDD